MLLLQIQRALTSEIHHQRSEAVPPHSIYGVDNNGKQKCRKFIKIYVGKMDKNHEIYVGKTDKNYKIHVGKADKMVKIHLKYTTQRHKFYI